MTYQAVGPCLAGLVAVKAPPHRELVRWSWWKRGRLLDIPMTRRAFYFRADGVHPMREENVRRQRREKLPGNFPVRFDVFLKSRLLLHRRGGLGLRSLVTVNAFRQGWNAGRIVLGGVQVTGAALGFLDMRRVTETEGL